MKIRYFLSLCLAIGCVLTGYLLSKYINEIIVEKADTPIGDYFIRDISCSFSYKMGSHMNVIYLGNEYVVDLPKDMCREIEDGLLCPELYYNKMNDSLFIKGYNFTLVLLVLSFIFSIILPLIGFFVYKNELDNNYNTM